MAGKWTTEDLKVGLEMDATFWPNPVADSKFRFRATHLDGLRAPKVVLRDDPRIRPGVPCAIRIVNIRKRKREDRGAIEVEFVKQREFQFDGVYLDPLIAKQLQVLLESGLNILLDGPQGCGKTVLARSIARTLGMEFVFFNCGAVIEASDFLATIQVRASPTGHPVTDFLKTEVLESLEQAGSNPDRHYLVFLDELNRCPESARNALMPALDASRKIYHPIENRFLEIPANVQFVAAVNRGSSFSGTFGIDAAQLDRFAPLQMGYPPVEEEVKLLRPRHAEMNEKLIRLVVEVADAIRKTPELSAGLSVRATDEVCTYLKHPQIAPQRKALLPFLLRSSFCGRFPGLWSDAASDAGLAWTIIQRFLAEKKVIEMWSNTMLPSLADQLKQARVIDLEQPRFQGMPIHPSHKPGYFYALHRRHRDTYQPAVHGPRSGASGMLTMMEHSGTHIDALCHQACGLKVFGGVDSDSIETPTGFKQLGIEHVPPLLTRGVLLDVATWKGQTPLPQNYSISADDLIGCARAENVELEKGDVLLVRTGYDTLWHDEATYLQAAGVGESGTLWASDKGVVAVGADNMAWDAPKDVDPETGATLFGHVHLLTRKGIYIIENLDLRELARAKQYAFAFLGIPLKFQGATGSPIRPLALV